MCRILLILFWLFAFGFNSHKSTAQVKLFTNDELPTDHVYRILQDKEGYIWILTEEGIVKYNGTDTKTFTVKEGLPSNDVFDGYFTDNNQFWFFCKGNELGYIENDSVHSFILSNVNSISYNGIKFRKNDVIYQENNGLKEYQLIDNKWIEKPFTIKEDGIKTYYLNTNSIYYSRLTPSNELTFYNKKNKELFSFSDPEIDIDKNIYFNTYNNYLTIKIQLTVFFVDLDNYEITKLDLQKCSVKEPRINFINGQFQITGKSFVVKLNDKFEIEEEYRFDEKYNAHANLIDAEGNIWIGSFTTGVHFLSKEAYYAILKDKEKEIQQSVLLKNNLYYTDYKGITEFNSNQHFYTEDKYFTTVAQLDGQLFIGKQINVNTNVIPDIIEESLNSELVRVSAYPITKIIKNKNTTYIGSFTSTILFNNTNLVHEDLKRGHYNSFATYNDSLIYGNNNGLHYFETDDCFSDFTKPVKCTEVNNNKLYIGTIGYGLSVLENGVVQNYSLENTIINNVLIYGDSLLFCATNKGVICLKESGDSLVSYYLYDKKDGLISNHVNAVHIDSYDNIYIATKKGILKTKLKLPSDVLRQTYPILVNYVMWNDVIIKDSIYNFVNEKPFNTLDIKFSSVKFSESEFYYKLNESSFNKIDRGEINLDNLPPGDFKLTLKIKSPFSKEETRILHFFIKPKWYKTNWFLSALSVAVLILLLLIVRYNRRKKRDKTISKLKEQAELSDHKLQALRSQMNPHFVFNSLNSIQYYISANKNDLSEKYLVKFSNLIRKFFDLSTQKEISVRKEKELLDNYLEIEKMRFEGKLNYTITIDEQLDETTLIPTMILQPIVENAVNHGIFHKEEEGLVSISFNKTLDQKIEVIITDDGIGLENSKSIKFTSTYKHLSKSSLIFKERIDLLNKSDQWEIDYSIEKLRDHPIYPGTKTTITLERKKDESDTD